MKIPPEYGGLGLSQLYYNRALMIVGSVSPGGGRAAVGAPVDRRPAAAGAVRHGGAEAALPAALRPRRDQRVPAHRARRRLGSGAAGTTAVPSEDGSEYILNGVKLWTTNGVVADLLVVMAQVPKIEGTAAASPRSWWRRDAEGITVEHRNTFLGLRGLENGVTRFHEVRVPAANRIGKEGQGLKIALVTLNTGRLSLPAILRRDREAGVQDRREWSAGADSVGQADRRARGRRRRRSRSSRRRPTRSRPIVDLSSQLADDKHSDIRIEAALAKLYCSEMAWRLADELVQVRGGRGYETAASLAARGERGVPAEQMLRDMRINRIFEGSTGDHAPVHRPRGGRRAPGGGGRADRAGRSRGRKSPGGRRAGGFYGRWLPTLVVGEGLATRARTRSSARWRSTCGTWSDRAGSSPGQRSTGWPAGRASWSASRASSAGSWTSAPSCSR